MAEPQETLPAFVTGSGEIFRPVDAAQVDRLREAGLKEAGAGELHHEELRKQYSSWMYAPVAAGLGALHTAVPGATGAVLTGLDAVSHSTGQAASDALEGIQASNPVPYGGGMLAGAVVPGAADVAAGVLTGPAGAAAVGAASFMGMTFDDLALKHINTPEGAEKTAAALAESAGVGALLGVTGFGVAAWIGKKGLSIMGAKLEAGAEKTLAKETAVGNPGVQARLEETQAVEATNTLIEKYDLLGKGKAGVQAELKRVASKAEKAMQEAKTVTTETLPLEEQISYARKLQQAVGDTPGLMEHAAGAPFRKPQTVSELHALRTKLDDMVNWEEVTSPLSQRMIAARDLVDEQITKTFQHATTVTDRPELVAGQLSRWQSASEDLLASKALQDALKYSEATGQSFIQKAGRKLSSYAGSLTASAAVGLATGNPGLGLATAPLAYAAGKGLQNAGRAYAKTVLGAGKMMQAFDKRLTGAVLGFEKLEKWAEGGAADAVAPVLGKGERGAISFDPMRLPMPGTLSAQERLEYSVAKHNHYNPPDSQMVLHPDNTISVFENGQLYHKGTMREYQLKLADRPETPEEAAAWTANNPPEPQSRFEFQRQPREPGEPRLNMIMLEHPVPTGPPPVAKATLAAETPKIPADFRQQLYALAQKNPRKPVSVDTVVEQLGGNRDQIVSELERLHTNGNVTLVRDAQGMPKTIHSVSAPRTVAGLSLKDYISMAGGLAAMGDNPAEAVRQLSQHLEDRKVPGPITDAVVPQQIRAVQYLNSQVPKSPWTGTTVAPTPWQPGLSQRTQFLDKVNAVSNPLQAFTNPTVENMAAVKAVYPIMAQKAALMASQYAAARPNLSRAERRRLSLISGIPASPLASPQSQAIMAQVNAAAQQQMAQGQGGQTAPQRRGSATGQMVSFADNQLGRMAGNRTA